MDEKTVKKIYADSENFASDLMEIAKYPPFTVFDEKKQTLINFIKDNVYGPGSQGNEIFSYEGEKLVIDNSKKKAVDALNKIQAMLDDENNGLDGELLNDVEEARLYRKRHGDPFRALMAASDVYPETDLKKHIF